MDFDSQGRIQISNELPRLLVQQTEFFKNGAKRGHTPDELRGFEKSRAHVQVLFELLEQRSRPCVRTCLGPAALARQFRRSRATFWPIHNAMPQLQTLRKPISIPLRLSHSRLPKSKTQFQFP